MIFLKNLTRGGHADWGLTMWIFGGLLVIFFVALLIVLKRKK
jgi:hypothetical protein